jgi:hypothetical protein
VTFEEWRASKFAAGEPEITAQAAWDHQQAEIDRLTEQISNMRIGGQRASTLMAERDRYKSALEFYADPDTYVAIGFFPDPPCGEFMEDFEEGRLIAAQWQTDWTEQSPDRGRPGKRARAALEPQP